MADDEDDWFAASDDPPPPEPKSLKKRASEAQAAEEAPAEGGEAPAEGAPPEEPPAAEEEYLDPNKLILFKHWTRPKFLQYKYLYDYRYNYYNDVIDYLDKRQRGVGRDIPHAQTWGERVLRTYNSRINKIETFRRFVSDAKLVTVTRLSGMFHLYHSKNYINRKYSSILV